MTNEKEILARFDEKYPSQTGVSGGVYITMYSTDEMKAFILAELRAKDARVREAIEGMKVPFITMGDADEHADYNQALTDLLARLFPETK